MTIRYRIAPHNQGNSGERLPRVMTSPPVTGPTPGTLRCAIHRHSRAGAEGRWQRTLSFATIPQICASYRTARTSRA
jgi:hypothetical protein